MSSSLNSEINIDKLLKLNKNYLFLYKKFLLCYEEQLDLEDYIYILYNNSLHLNDQNSQDILPFIITNDNKRFNYYYKNIELYDTLIDELIEKTSDLVNPDEFSNFIENYKKITDVYDNTLRTPYQQLTRPTSFEVQQIKQTLSFESGKDDEGTQSQLESQPGPATQQSLSATQQFESQQEEDQKRPGAQGGSKKKKKGGSISEKLLKKIDDSRFTEKDVIYKERKEKKKDKSSNILYYLQLCNTDKENLNLIKLSSPAEKIKDDDKITHYLLIADIIHDIKEIRISSSVQDYHGLFLIKDSFDNIIKNKKREINLLFTDNILPDPNSILVTPENVAMNFLLEVSNKKLNGTFKILEDYSDPTNIYNLDKEKYNHTFIDMLGENMNKRLNNFKEHTDRIKATIGTLLDESPVTSSNENWTYPTKIRLDKELKMINDYIIPKIQSLFSDLNIFNIELLSKITNGINIESTSIREKDITNSNDFKTLPNNKDFNVFHFTIQLKDENKKYEKYEFRWKRVGVAKLKKLILFKDEKEYIINDLSYIFTTKSEFHSKINENNIVSIINSMIFMWKTIGDYSQSFLSNIPSEITNGGGYKFKKLTNIYGSGKEEKQPMDTEVSDNTETSKRQRSKSKSDEALKKSKKEEEIKEKKEFDYIKEYMDLLINTKLIPTIQNKSSKTLQKTLEKSNFFISGDRICAVISALNSNISPLDSNDIIIYHSTRNNAFIYEKNLNYFNNSSIINLLNKEYEIIYKQLISLTYEENKIKIIIKKNILEEMLGIKCNNSKINPNINFDYEFDSRINESSTLLSNKINDYTLIKNYIETNILYMMIYRYNYFLKSWFNIDVTIKDDSNKLKSNDYNEIELDSKEEDNYNSYLRQKNNLNEALKESNKIYESINKFNKKLKNNLKTIKTCYGRLINSNINFNSDNISDRTVAKILNFVKEIINIFKQYNTRNNIITNTLKIIDDLIYKINKINSEIKDFVHIYKKFDCEFNKEDDNLNSLIKDINLYIENIQTSKITLNSILSELESINNILDKIKDKSESQSKNKIQEYFVLYKEFHEKVKSIEEIEGMRLVGGKNKKNQKKNQKKNLKSKKTLKDKKNLKKNLKNKKTLNKKYINFIIR